MRILRDIFNRILHLLAQFSPGATTIRPFLHRLRGVKIQGKVFIGDQVYLENEYPSLIELRDGAGIALRVTLMAHAHNRQARIILEKDAQVMPGSSIFAATEDVIIGEGSVVGAGSLIMKSVPPHVFVAGNPPKLIAECTVTMKIDTPLDEWKNGLEIKQLKK